MKTAAELYPEEAKEEAEDGGFYGPSDYQPIIDSFGEAMVQVDDNDYQGDSRVLLKEGDRYGVMIFGWGSCSGCDALQACNTLAEVDELVGLMASQVRWGSAEETLTYLKEHDWKGDFGFHTAEGRDFVRKGIDHLSERLGVAAEYPASLDEADDE